MTAANPTRIVEGFSISHAAILDGTTGADAVGGDVYGIRDGTLEPDTDSFDNTGDDAVLSTWMWLNGVTLTVTGGYVPFDLVALMTGETIQSSGAGATVVYQMPMWTQASLNVSPKPVLVRVPSKDSDGAVRTLDIVLYRVQFGPITFNGPTYKDGLVINYNGKALLSAVDEKGASLGGSVRAIGRLISKP